MFKECEEAGSSETLANTYETVLLLDEQNPM
jgi:hypothetical protein